MWVARDSEGRLFLFHEKPTRSHRTPELMESMFPGKEGNWYPDGMFSWRLGNAEFNENISWEDEPVEVNIIPKCTNKINEEELETLADDIALRERSTEGSYAEGIKENRMEYRMKRMFKLGYRKAVEEK